MAEVNPPLRRRDALVALSVIAAAGLTARVARAAVPERLAIVCDADDDDGRAELSRFRSRLGGAILKSGNFSLVDRDRLERIIREQGFSNSAYADPQTAAKLGRLAGAQRFLNVTLTADYEGQAGTYVTTIAYHATAAYTLVDVSTGRVGSEGTGDGEAEDKAAAGSGVSTMSAQRVRRQAIDACADDVAQQLTA